MINACAKCILVLKFVLKKNPPKTTKEKVLTTGKNDVYFTQSSMVYFTNWIKHLPNTADKLGPIKELCQKLQRYSYKLSFLFLRSSLWPNKTRAYDPDKSLNLTDPKSRLISLERVIDVKYANAILK